jgi:hypothetical protein
LNEWLVLLPVAAARERPAGFRGRFTMAAACRFEKCAAT